MGKKDKARKLLIRYFIYPLISILFFWTMAFFAFRVHRRTGLGLFFMAVLGSALLIVWLWYIWKNLEGILMDFSMSNEKAQGIFSQDLDLPYALMDRRGTITWRNRAFNGLVAGDKLAKKSIHGMFETITGDDVGKVSDKKDFYGRYMDRDYRIRIARWEAEDLEIFALYLYDETRLLALEKETLNNQEVVGLIYVDNYEEAVESIEEVRHSLLEALIDRKINQYIGGLEGIVKKLEKDKFFFVLKYSQLERAIAGRFDLLEDMKTVNIGNEMSVTLSIGIGLGGDNLAHCYEFARMAIDMALGRGGDQAVIKNDQGTKYFGGKSPSVEKNTRVKARVKAHALRELLENKDRVIIMGHKLLDIDAFGAAIGIWRISHFLNTKAHIVLGNVNPSATPMIERFKKGDYPDELFVTEERAKDLANANTVLVVVDVNRPSITEAPDLLKKIKTIVVLDHHRQSSEIIDNAVLSYVEPFASSACEMVAEVVQYIDDNLKIKMLEADAMYAGIVIDTHNFNNQTGVRTFEAAAFLRRNGADVTRVRKMFREDVDDYRAKAEAIHNAEIYEKNFAISECLADSSSSPTLVCAQAANELLDIRGIKASFVMTLYNETVYISARSIDEINVQIIMEKLGGGGHRSVAGAQLKNIGIADAKRQLKELITDMLEKGEI